MIGRLLQPIRVLLAPLGASWREFWRPKSLGERGERVAAKFLRRQGYTIVAHSQRMRIGEIDLIAVDHDTLVLVEVKTRRSHRAGNPIEAVNEQKQQKLTKLAQVYRRRHGLTETPTRFDCVAVTWPEDNEQPTIKHYQNAFEAIG